MHGLEISRRRHAVGDENLKKMLGELAEQTTERAPVGVSQEIKAHIPQSLHAHRRGMDTINIVIDLRVGKLAAAAAIIVTMILLANYHGLYSDGRTLAKYLFGPTSQSDILTGKVRYDHLTKQGINVVRYDIDTADSNSVLMHWKTSDGKYRVVFGDLREEQVTAQQLIELQARMLQKQGK